MQGMLVSSIFSIVKRYSQVLIFSVRIYTSDATQWILNCAVEGENNLPKVHIGDKNS